ncbi:MAG: hypothetical protein MRY32_01225 [Rickettsiales bacterium]|nr:hypothetical protein [Rickettsiales bacterium]
MYYITSSKHDDALHADILKLTEHADAEHKTDPVHHWLLHYGIIDPSANLQQTRADFQLLRDVRRSFHQSMRILWATLFKALAIAFAAIIGLGVHSYIQQMMSAS